MADPVRQYFDNLAPANPGKAALVNVSRAWTNLQKTLFVTAPASLDRTRVWRNRFASAVKFNG